MIDELLAAPPVRGLLRFASALAWTALLTACSEDVPTGASDAPNTDVAQVDTHSADVPGVDPADAADTAQSTPCTKDEDCAAVAGGDPCIEAWCDAGSCKTTMAPNATPCDDANACTRETVCFQGACGGIATIEASPGDMGSSCFDNNDCDSGFCITLTESKQICTELCLESCPKGFQCKSVVNLQQDVVFICVPLGGTGFAVDCADDDPCTTDACDPEAGCVHAPNQNPCDDGNACTEADICDSGLCVGSPSAACACATDADCAPFDDGNLCNGWLRCVDGSCAADPATVVKCPAAQPGSCVAPACDPATGACVDAALPNGSGCSDGNGCTQPDRCEAGVCASGADLCGPCGSDAECAPFDDGNLCNGTLGCVGGTCTVAPGSVPVCIAPAGASCATSACDPATGGCVAGQAGNGTPCADGDPCTLGDLCVAGLCKSGVTVCDPCATAPAGSPCSDGDPCTAGDTCQGGVCAGGLNQCDACAGIAEGGPCDDQDPCTSDDACHDGVCGGAAYDCEDEDQCTDDLCTGEGGCTFPLSADGTPCVDDDVCSSDDLCKAGVCTSGAGQACDDGSPCTQDACDPEAGCSFGPADFGIPCEDGDPCTIDDLCVGGFCFGGGAPDCDDGAPCTTDACDVVLGCVHAATSGGPCDAGDACLGTGTCTTGVCVPGKPTPCDDANPCTDDSCDPASGCHHVPNTAPCTDGNGCTASDTCAGGACVSGANICQCTTDAECAALGDACTKLVCVASGPFSFCVPDTVASVSCPPSSSPCAVNACDPTTGTCALQPSNEGAACEDGDACTAQSACLSGQCAGGASLPCDDGNPCTADACDVAAGCLHTPTVAACDDANACTIGEACSGGTCSGGTFVSCDDGDPCTDDACVPATGCASAPNVAPCDDANACTTGDTCAGGACVGGANLCTCDTDADCAPFDDGDPCTGVVLCDKSGATPECKVAGGSVVTCDGSNDTACIKSVCSPTTGACAPVPITDGAPCDDGDACTVGDACNSGLCASATPSVCDDGNPCTADACNPATGCTSVPQAGPCEDGNACTVGDACADGTCASGANQCACSTDDDCAAADDGDLCNGRLMCDTLQGACALDVASVVKCPGAGNPCQAVACQPSTGACIITEAAEGQPCDDGNACTTLDVCSAGQCKGALPVSCNDGNMCTADSCNPATGCVNAPITAPCEDGDLCTKGDKCVAGACAPGNNVCKCKDTADCVKKDDGNACNGNYLCAGGSSAKGKPTGTCVAAAGSVVTCVDESAYDCVVAYCAPATGLCDTLAAATGTACDDGDACTIGDHCLAGTCVGSATLACDDGNPCTADTCDPGAGCTSSPAPGPCDDGLACTTGETCEAGACVPANNDCGCEADTDCVQWEDGNLCNGTLRCWNGTCAPDPATVVTCPPTANACTVALCEPTTGSCTVSPVTDGAPCSDLDPCTWGDACLGGACAGAATVACDDQNQCTTDTCTPGLGCVHTPRQGQCDDGNPCAGPDICMNGLCLPKDNKCK